MTDELANRIEDTLGPSEDELEDELSAQLEDAEGQPGELVEKYPELFGRLVGHMDEMDIGRFVAETPRRPTSFRISCGQGSRCSSRTPPRCARRSIRTSR